MNPHLFLWHCIYKGLHNSFKKWLLTPLGGSAHYDTPGRLTLRSMRPQGDFVWKTWLTWRNLTKIENILTHCSDEKNGGRKLVWPRGQRQPYCCICAAHFDLFSLSAPVGGVARPPPPPLCATWSGRLRSCRSRLCRGSLPDPGFCSNAGVSYPMEISKNSNNSAKY